ncbi:hypothetical protein CEUSTIGMA_g8579.t1 [Chlamydomonas eustigma]|uniref:Nucleotide-diphospho-sugar transferase domain-containing protein n=1 Tax=Chlamydomonas eustigma TaxID=1157962 RepID=A0A250XDK4_9CHLO|nr:hypothetical protein CEUSTIGMA_g8579.t1 [Chlamydomonas eustigma]|eukprot:GAX81146.1 hypothetical protein CEUSTIGMA_g8579.t1 [Chlamydomonas eustigma]
MICKAHQCILVCVLLNLYATNIGAKKIFGAQTDDGHGGASNMTSSSDVVERFNKVYITGTIKEARVYLPSIMGNTYILASLFPSYSIIFACDDEENVKILSQWSKVDPKVKILYKNVENMTWHQDKIPWHGSYGRTDKLALARNMLLDEVQRQQSQDLQHSTTQDKQALMVVTDLDDVSENILNTTMMQHVLQRSDEWDSVSFNTGEHYYDVWALRYGSPEVNVWSYDFVIKDPSMSNASSWDTINNEKARIKTTLRQYNGSFFPVASAFNGIALYKLQYIEGCSYVGWEKWADPTNKISEGWHDCEHVPFHKCMIQRNKARVVIFTPSSPYQPTKWVDCKDACAARSREVGPLHNMVARNDCRGTAIVYSVAHIRVRTVLQGH